jgi:allophanate hydrolase subunit 1
MAQNYKHIEYKYGETKWGTVLELLPATDYRKEIFIRVSGDDSIFVEYGREMHVDYMDMFRIQAANQELMYRQIVGWTSLEGFLGALPQWRTIQYTFDPRIMPMKRMVDIAKDIEEAVGDDRNIARMEFNSPIIELPLCWEHSAVKKAIEKYLREIRPGGAPNIDSKKLSNVPYIAQCNGISEEEVKEKIYGTDWFSYTMCFLLGLVMDVALDRRCNMLTNKYNPPRTWTERSTWAMGGFDVGWYASAGAGGYELLGLVAPVLQTEQIHPAFKQDIALVHTLDRLHIVEVSESELDRITKLVDSGSPEYVYKKTPGVFSVAEWLEFEKEHATEISKWQKYIRGSFEKTPIP